MSRHWRNSWNGLLSEGNMEYLVYGNMESSFIRFKLQANISIKLLTALNDYSFKLGKNIRGHISIETAKANFKIGNTSISRNKNVWNFVQLDMLSWTMNLMSLSGSMNFNNPYFFQSLFYCALFYLTTMKIILHPVKCGWSVAANLHITRNLNRDQP